MSQRAVDAFWVPLYSSIYLRESHVQGNRFDLGNPGLDVPVQSTKIAIDADGVIVYRAGYGKGTGKGWISVFEKLTEETSET